jgi:SpoVK/Ycf46/Vps4 family AAA+-type ATPase
MNATRELFESRLRVQGDIPDSYVRWFSQPWMRIYTLNIDNLDYVVSSSGELPVSISVVSAISDGLATASQNVLSVHLNGTLEDFPHITFSQPQYGERLARPDSWYQQLVRDLMSSPVVFVGTELNEPPLWQHLELRGARGTGRERRPRSYLVCPTLPAARQAMLRNYNVEWIPVGQSEFVEQVLWPMEVERRQGAETLRRKRAPKHAADVLLKVSELRTQPSEDVREFMMGRQPEWADLAEGGYAIVRSFEAGLGTSIEQDKPRLVVLTGTAGCGKSTTLMRLGLQQHAVGQNVRWLDLMDNVSLGRIAQEVKREAPEVLLIDELNQLGDSAGVFLSGLLESCPELMIVGALRSSKKLDLASQTGLNDSNLLQFTIPNLENIDIEALLSALDAAGKLGRLKGMTPVERTAALRREAGRQLLVAMLQATSGKRFDDKICSEIRDLTSSAAAIYGAVALASSIRTGLTRQEIMLAAGEATHDSVGLLQSMLDRRILIRRDDLILARHRLIAEHVVKHFKREGHLAETVRGVAFALSTSVSPDTRQSRPMSILIRLLNHDWLIENLHGQWEDIQGIYDHVERTLGWDPHYWLQRGSFEVERGDLRAAETFLESARSMAPHDYRVQTEWGYMQLRRATHDSEESGSVQIAAEAFDELDDAIARRGDSDPYPFHVMGSAGLEFVEVAPLGRDEKLRIVLRIRRVVEDGCRRHRNDQALSQLATNVERVFLMIGAVE